MRRRISLTALFLSPFALMSVLFILYGYRVNLRAVLNIPPGAGFTPVPDFPLRDSLPALEGGLSNLEAFKVTMSPSWRANRDRSLWVSDTIGSVSVDYLTDRGVLDSVTFMVWTDGAPLMTRTFRSQREVTLMVDVGRKVQGWAEVVAVYQSFPALMPFRSSDTSVSLFTQVEGKVFHVVNGWYLGRRNKPLDPDTSYPVVSHGVPSEPLQLLARGNALAVVNESKLPVRLRLLGSGGGGSVILEVDSSQVAVYRKVLVRRTGRLLAYTDPGTTYPVFRATATELQQFFTLTR